MPREKRETVQVKRGPGRPRVNFEARRDEIIRAATRLFARQGFHATSMSDICEAAGVGRGVLYHYIESKEDILIAIHERFIVPLLERTAEIRSAGGSPDVVLAKISRELMQTIHAYHDEVTVFLHEWHALVGTEYWEHVRAKRREFERTIQETIEQGRGDIFSTQLDSRLAMLAFLGMHNYAYQWLRAEGRFGPQEIADQYSRIFLEGILLRQGRGGASPVVREMSQNALDTIPRNNPPATFARDEAEVRRDHG